MYLGLIIRDGAELRAPSYRRVCIDHVRWAMLPGHKHLDPPGHVTFANLDTIAFPEAQEHWGVVSIRLFLDAAGGEPLPSRNDNWITVYQFFTVHIARGDYRFTATMIP